METSSDELLTAAQVAEKAGVSREAVRKAIDAGRLAAKRVGPVWGVEPAAADAYAREIREKADAEVQAAQAKLEKAKQRARKHRKTPRGRKH